MTILPARRRRRGAAGAGAAPTNKFLAVSLRGSDRITIFNVNDPTAPDVLGSVTHANLNTAMGMTRGGDADAPAVLDWLLVNNDVNGRAVSVDISNKTTPTVVAELTALYQGVRWGIYKSPYHIHLSRTTDKITSFSISGAGVVSEIDEITDGVNLDGPTQAALSSSGDYWYVPEIDDNNMEIYDISDPTALARVGTGFAVTGLSTPTFCVRSGSNLFIGSWGNDTIYVCDLPTETTIDTTPIGSVSDAVNLNQPSWADLVGSKLYVGGLDFFTVVDVSTPASPSIDGQVALTGGNAGYVTAGPSGYVFCADRNGNAVHVINVSTPATPAIDNSISDAHAEIGVGEFNEPLGLLYWEEAA